MFSWLLDFRLSVIPLIWGQGEAARRPSVYSAFYGSQEPLSAPPSPLVGRLPALGWNSWNAYACDIDASKVEAAARQIVSLGLKDAGYEYVNIDDCWSELNRTAGKLVPDPTKFPKGMNGVSDTVHGLGLKLGIYSDAGLMTCAKYPASFGYEAVDAASFSDWGVDYLKYDNCNVPQLPEWDEDADPPNGDWYEHSSAIRYRRMADELAKQSRPIQLSICIWGRAHVWEWGARVGHSWRMTFDIVPTWESITSMLIENVKYLDYIDFSAHNDMDMMEVGNGDLTVQEERTHFASWCFFKSPILLGTDLSKLSKEQLAIITNKELLAFHQDGTVGKPAYPFTAYSGAEETSPAEYYGGGSSKGTHVFIINTSNATTSKHFDFSAVPGLVKSKNYKLHDMWTGRDVSGVHDGSGSYSVDVEAHDTVAYLISPA